MFYKLTSSTWLAREVERTKGVLMVHMESGREYTAKELVRLCRDLGLDYDKETFKKIGAALVKEGVLEEVS